MRILIVSQLWIKKPPSCAYEMGSNEVSTNVTDSNVAIEGHLCPICKTNCDSIEELAVHFQAEHSDDQDSLKTILSLLGKNKRKTQNQNESNNEPSQLNEDEWSQHIGRSRCHMDFFKNIRSSRLEYYAAESNKLLIRLDKLLKIVTKSDQKNQEQTVVEWVDDTHVKLCPFCAKSFNISRRKHHCRLCGSIMCNSCTCFLTVQNAKNYMSTLAKDKKEYKMSDELREEHIRACDYCIGVLEKKYATFLSQHSESSIDFMHDQISQVKKDVLPLLQQYKTMCDSLHNGDTIYGLKDAQMLRKNLEQYTERFRLLSKAISKIEIPSTSEDHISRKCVQLKNALNQSIGDFIKTKLLALRELPTAKELDSIRTHREMMVKHWSPATVKHSNKTEESDPMLVQIEIIKNYIKQAKDDSKFEEIEILKNNLKELKDEYKNKLKATANT